MSIQLDFTNSVKTCLDKYIDFTGRAARPEFWYWFLFTVLVAVVLGFVAGILDAILGIRLFSHIVRILLFFGFALPNIAVAMRRLHDTDKSGWWLLLPIAAAFLSGLFSVIPYMGLLRGLFSLATLVGAIILLVWYCMPGTKGPNQYGGEPIAG
jgi:uncharacterized membrane protein YhaH (DUF805 family)